jgi:hypothetical protein
MHSREPHPKVNLTLPRRARPGRPLAYRVSTSRSCTGVRSRATVSRFRSISRQCRRSRPSAARSKQPTRLRSGRKPCNSPGSRGSRHCAGARTHSDAAAAERRRYIAFRAGPRLVELACRERGPMRYKVKNIAALDIILDGLPDTGDLLHFTQEQLGGHRGSSSRPTTATRFTQAAWLRFGFTRSNREPPRPLPRT